MCLFLALYFDLYKLDLMQQQVLQSPLLLFESWSSRSALVCALTAVRYCHLHKCIWLNGVQRQEEPVRVGPVHCASDSSLLLRCNFGSSSVSDSPCKHKTATPTLTIESVKNRGGARSVCQIKVHCMSLTLAAGDLASGHVPDLGKFQVLLSTIIPLTLSIFLHDSGFSFCFPHSE